jgi:hypothetical protein
VALGASLFVATLRVVALVLDLNAPRPLRHERKESDPPPTAH